MILRLEMAVLKREGVVMLLNEFELMLTASQTRRPQLLCNKPRGEEIYCYSKQITSVSNRR